MKLRFKILIFNALALFVAWILIGKLGQDYSDNFPSENVLNKMLSVIGYVYALFLLISTLIFCISILGTIIFGLIKKKELFLGLTIYLTQY